MMNIIYSFMILALLFSSGSMIGWGIEVFYRRFKPDNKERIWINPGFLTGPCLPLYGFGLTLLYLLAMLEDKLPIESGALKKLMLFCLMAAAMTLIELAAGELFIIRRNLKLWDYTNEKFNYKGLICPRFSFYWALLGAFYYFFIHPHILSGLRWFSHNLLFSFVIGFFYGVLAIDLSYSFSIANKIKAFAEEHEMVIRYEELKRHIKLESEKRRAKYRFLYAIGSSTSFRDDLRSYLEKQFEHAREGMRSDFMDRRLEELKKEFTDKIKRRQH